MSVLENRQFADALRAWLPRQRWFGGGLPETVAVDAVLPLGDGSQRAAICLLGVRMPDAEFRRIHLPLGFRAAGTLPAGSPAITVHDGVACYDGLTDPVIVSELVRRTCAGGAAGDLRFVPEPTISSPVGESVRPVRSLGTEQSNTSVVYDDRLILKVFRRLHLGVNPDLEVHRALSRAGCTEIAPLAGTIETTMDGAPLTLGILQEFAADAVDGWAMAQASIRESLADPARSVEQAGGDLTAEMFRLGRAVASVHQALATAFGTWPVDPRRGAARMLERFDGVAALAPDLVGWREAAESVFDAAFADGAGVTGQRVHGDLHLGQVLRTNHGWVLIDFEGEPSSPISERVEPDLPARDLAGMTRSLDYAAERHLAEAPGGSAAATVDRARAWAAANRREFLAGYGDPGPAALLRAYELDKAVYEVGYELRHRPQWVETPLRAIARLLGTGE